MTRPDAYQAHARERAARGTRMRPWRERLDARIARCPGCDQWAWDGTCSQCSMGACVRDDSYGAGARPQHPNETREDHH